MNSGVLYLCPTPIGNLKDITYRTIEIFNEVDFIACEDTRRTLLILKHYNISKNMVSYHEFNKASKGLELIKKLIDGKSIALATDAGTPGISDPGYDLVKLAIENNIKIVSLPGAVAGITALVASGLSTEKFVFEGFLSTRERKKTNRLEELKEEKRTIIFYEAPHRILETLHTIREILGDRKICVARELTKIYEEYYRGTISEAIDYFSIKGIKGEFVLVVEGFNDEKIINTEDIKKRLIELIEDGNSKKDAVKLVSNTLKIPKNIVYKESLEI